ncbi:unnamed protein product, partial [Ilex paraguariensis]
MDLCIYHGFCPEFEQNSTKKPDVSRIPITTPTKFLNFSPKSRDITKNFASLFKKPTNKEIVLPFLSVSAFPPSSVDHLGSIKTFHMPLHSPLYHNQSCSNITSPSIFPSTVSTSANIQMPSLVMEFQIPNVPSSIPLPHVPLMNRDFPALQTQLPGRGSQLPVDALTTQHSQSAQITPDIATSVPFISATPSKPAKRVVFNNGGPGMYWSPDKTQELSKGFNLTLIGKCAYGKPSLGVVKEFINSRWLLKGDFT